MTFYILVALIAGVVSFAASWGVLQVDGASCPVERLLALGAGSNSEAYRLVFLEDGQPARKVRYEFVDTVNLLSTDDARTTINVSTPREEIRLVPVQTF